MSGSFPWSLHHKLRGPIDLVIRFLEILFQAFMRNIWTGLFKFGPYGSRATNVPLSTCPLRLVLFLAPLICHF